MKSPSIYELPKAPVGKLGWPWTEESIGLPDRMSDGRRWPRISIVTPSYNQGRFIEETIRSVLLQGYPNLEYIIIDGGSMDGTVDIIKKYEPWLTYWISELDRGQSYAINKGFKRSTGEIMAWINSDDFYCPGTFQKIAEYFSKEDFGWLAGKCTKIGIDGSAFVAGARPPSALPYWLIVDYVSQPSVFWKSSLWKHDQPLDESMHYSFDYELWIRFLSNGFVPGWIDQPLSNFRYHAESKSVKEREEFRQENKFIFNRYYSTLRLNERFKVQLLLKKKFLDEWLEMEDTINHPFIRMLQALKNSRLYSTFRKQFFTKEV